MIFGNFSQVPMLQMDTEAEGTLKIHITPIFFPFSTFVWVLTHTFETTGLDQLSNHCVKLQ